MATPRSSQKIQWGPESVAGTKVAATTIWRGQVNRLKDTRTIKRIPENVGLLVPTNRSITTALRGELDIPSSVATFQQLQYFGEMGIKAVGTGVKDGAGSGYKYDYPFPVSSTKNAIKTYSIEAGDGQDAEVMEYAHLAEFKLSGARDAEVMVDGKFVGRQVAVQAFTPALTLPVVTSIPCNNVKLFIDDAGGTIGTTAQSNTINSFTTNCKTGWKPVPTGDGTLYFGIVDYADPEVTLDIVFIYNANATGAKAKWRAETAALIRLLFEGANLATGGTFTKETLRLDFAGKWTSFDVPAEKDGFQVCTGKFTCMLDPVAALYFDMLVVADGLTTLP